MSTSLPLPSASLQLDSISRESRVHPVPGEVGGWKQTAQSAAAAQSATKRLIDVVGGILGLVLLFPLMLAIAVLVRLTSPGPALFRQLRQGQGGRPFWFLKFRTMTADAEHRLRDLEPFNEAAGGVLFKMRRDPRITALGRWLRCTSLDELPQLLNVLRGEMSLVGPRPLQMRDSALLEQLEPEAYSRRLSVLPGLTGAWQVGGRSETDSIERWSLWRDLGILCRTVGAVLRRRGAY
jgi:lipopolysaccharide/colanic/teichoic acid biosynthesis glycosyltransferase